MIYIFSQLGQLRKDATPLWTQFVRLWIGCFSNLDYFCGGSDPEFSDVSCQLVNGVEHWTET